MIAYLLALSIICGPAANKIEKAVESYVNGNFPVENAKYQFNYQRINWNMMPTDFDSISIFRIGKDNPLGSTVFTAGVYDGGKLLKAVPLSVEVTLLVDALVTKTPINVGGVIRELMTERRSISGRGEFPVTDSALFNGKQAKNYIPAGSVMYLSMVEARPAVKPGDKVDIIYEKSSFRITAVGVVRQRGGVGEKIKVVNDDSKKIVEAEVIDSMTVAVR